MAGSAALWNPARAHVMTTRAQSLPDEEIVRRFRETGDRECFAELFLRHRKRVYFACHGFFSNATAAEDATQETFLRVYRNPHGFEGGDVRAWLMRIARNVCIDEWRKSQGRAETEITQREMGHLVDTVPIDVSFEAREMAERVRREMQSLTPEQCRCLELKIEGYSYDETAARTGLSVDAVKSHLQNGRRMLWRRMEAALARLK